MPTTSKGSLARLRSLTFRRDRSGPLRSTPKKKTQVKNKVKRHKDKREERELGRETLVFFVPKLAKSQAQHPLPPCLPHFFRLPPCGRPTWASLLRTCVRWPCVADAPFVLPSARSKRCGPRSKQLYGRSAAVLPVTVFVDLYVWSGT